MKEKVCGISINDRVTGTPISPYFDETFVERFPEENH